MQLIGRYEIKRELGHGGFGRVYAAFDPTVGRIVAIKTLTGIVGPDLLARFRNEAATAGLLRHQNIVTIYDFGEHDGAPYLVMELLDGEDLQKVIAGRRELSIYDKVRILWEVADGLQHAHSNGVLHRDIKPANIMLLSDRGVKLLDFGIALVSQTAMSRLTPQGNLIGTYRYMSPEQFRGDSSDTLSDIFAFGIVSYELLTGNYPFHAKDTAGVMYRIVHDEPVPLRDFLADCPEDLEAIVLRILSKDRTARYQTLDDIKFDLEPMLLGLRKQRAEVALLEAKKRISNKDFEAAQSLTREVLELDRGNQEARQLRDQIQQALQHRANAPKVAALFDSALKKLDVRQFEEAIRDLESALRLDSTNSAVRQKIENARACLELFRRSEQHADQAKHALKERNLTSALDHANEALLVDPENTAAAALLKEIRTQWDLRERTRRLLALLRKAKGLLLLQSFDEAIELLENASTDFAATSEVADMLARARADNLAHQRELQLLGGIKAAKEMLRRDEFRDAVTTLEALEAEFPNTAEVRDLLEHARYLLNSYENDAAAENLIQQARRFAVEQKFGAAIQVLEAGLEKYPAQPGIRPVLQSICREQALAEKKRARGEALALARQLRDDFRFLEALRALNDYVIRHGTDNAIRQLADEIEFLVQKQTREEIINNRIAEINQAVQQQHLETALHIAQGAVAEYPDHGGLVSLLKQIREKQVQGMVVWEATSEEQDQAEPPPHAPSSDVNSWIAEVPKPPTKILEQTDDSRGDDYGRHRLAWNSWYLSIATTALILVSGAVAFVRVSFKEVSPSQSTPQNPPTYAPSTVLPKPIASSPKDDTLVPEASKVEIKSGEKHRISVEPRPNSAALKPSRTVLPRASYIPGIGQRPENPSAVVERGKTTLPDPPTAPVAQSEPPRLPLIPNLAILQPRTSVPSDHKPLEQEQILNALQNFEHALESRNLTQIDASWPGIPQSTRDGLRRSFRNDSVRYTVHLRALNEPSTDGNSASVYCERTAKTVAGAFGKRDQITRVRVRLSRVLNKWVIESIQDLP